MVGILLSYWGGLFSGAMLVSGRVSGICVCSYLLLYRYVGYTRVWLYIICWVRSTPSHMTQGEHWFYFASSYRSSLLNNMFMVPFQFEKVREKNEKSLSKLTVMIHISVTFPLHPSLNGKGGLWWWWHHLHGRGNGESRAPKKFLCWETSLNNGSKLLWKREDVFLVNKSFENLEVPVRYRQDKNCKEVVDGNYWVPGSQELSLEISLYFFPFS